MNKVIFDLIYNKLTAQAQVCLTKIDWTDGGTKTLK